MPKPPEWLAVGPIPFPVQQGVLQAPCGGRHVIKLRRYRRKVIWRLNETLARDRGGRSAGKAWSRCADPRWPRRLIKGIDAPRKAGAFRRTTLLRRGMRT